jgi:glycosyltransferase involved in cell wall biosynthesis
MGLAEVYRRLQRQFYLLKKYVASFGKPTIIYTKPHPIYTSVFESREFSKYNSVFIRLSKPTLGMLEKRLLNKASLVHADSANFPKTELDKPLVVECEGKPYDKYFESPSVKRILVESRIAGKDFWGNEKMELCYPTISAYGKRRENSSQPITLLCVGYGGYIKGYDVVYKLYKTLSVKYDIRLVIAGSLGHDYDSYKEVTREAYEREGFEKIQAEFSNDPKVVLRPFRREQLFEEIYPKADIFIQLSRMETFGYSILEAMSFGLPVVSCEFTAIREIVEDGVNGYLVRSNKYDVDLNDYRVNINSDDWGRNCYKEALVYIEQLIEKPELREKMGDRSLEIVKEKFNLNDKISYLDNLYSGLIGSN